MSSRVEFEPAARLEIENAFHWYQARRNGLGSRFLGAVEVAAHRIERNPEAFPRTRGPYRRVALEHFPYALHFAMKDPEVALVLACLHFRQSPARWPGGDAC